MNELTYTAVERCRCRAAKTGETAVGVVSIVFALMLKSIEQDSARDTPFI